jgi:hypothetical protein
MAKARGEDALDVLKSNLKTDPKIVMMVLLHARDFEWALKDLDVHPSRDTLTAAARELDISQEELEGVVAQLPAASFAASSFVDVSE